jgi:hypothetical protein
MENQMFSKNKLNRIIATLLEKVNYENYSEIEQSLIAAYDAKVSGRLFEFTARLADWKNIVNGIVQMITSPSDYNYVLSEFRRQWRDREKGLNDAQKKKKTSGRKQQELLSIMSNKPHDEYEDFIATMQEQGFGREPFDNSRKTKKPAIIDDETFLQNILKKPFRKVGEI